MITFINFTFINSNGLIDNNNYALLVQYTNHILNIDAGGSSIQEFYISNSCIVVRTSKPIISGIPS